MPQSPLTQYAQVALLAADAAAAGTHPDTAWQQAAARIIVSPSSRKKSCPRLAFLGLANAGVIKEVPLGYYGHAGKNADYALQALAVLREGAVLSPLDLWVEATRSAAAPLAYNQQCHVVLALWQSGRLTR